MRQKQTFDVTTREGRAARRAARLAELAPLGFTDANYVTKPVAEHVLGLLEARQFAPEQRKALEALRTRLVSGSMKVTTKARKQVRVFELAERIEQALA